MQTAPGPQGASHEQDTEPKILPTKPDRAQLCDFTRKTEALEIRIAELRCGQDAIRRAGTRRAEILLQNDCGPGNSGRNDGKNEDILCS